MLGVARHVLVCPAMVTVPVTSDMLLFVSWCDYNNIIIERSLDLIDLVLLSGY